MNDAIFGAVETFNLLVGPLQLFIYAGILKSLWSPDISILPCQGNLIKTFQNEAITPLITNIALIFFKHFLSRLLDPQE